jgi:ribonuclease HI
MRTASHERELCGGELETTNNRMEMTAVIKALEALKRRVEVHIHTDSTYVQQGITTWIHGWKKNGWKTKAKEPVKNADLWRLLDEAVQQQDVTWHWVKGHAGHEGNEAADALANRGVEQVLATRR